MANSITAVHVLSVPTYSSIDFGRGRCRVPQSCSLLRTSSVAIGSIVKVQLHDCGQHKTTIEVLCTVWPDTEQALRDDEICIDDSVVFRDTPPLWTRQRATVLLAGQRRLATSFRTYCPQSAKVPLGTPLSSKCSARVGNISVQIRDVNPGDNCVVGPTTIQIVDNSAPLATPAEKSAAVASPTARTKVVLSLIDRLVRPLVLAPSLSSSACFHGILLLGPPGVGKSYAVKAVQSLCNSVVEIDVINVSIPDLLSASDPVGDLQRQLPPIRSKLPKSSSSTAASSSSSLSPMKSSSSNRFTTPLKQGTASPAPKQLSSNPKQRLQILQVDEIDALGHANAQNETQIALKLHMCQWLDKLQAHGNDQSQRYAVIATSNRSEDVDSCFRRGGRLECELTVLITKEDRRTLLCSYLSAALLSDQSLYDGLTETDIFWVAQRIAESAGGYVAADIAALTSELLQRLQASSSSPQQSAASLPVREQLLRDLVMCMRHVPPSCLRGVSVALPPQLSLDDVIGNEEAKRLLRRALSFTEPDKQAQLRRFGLDQGLGGVLLYGPPGNSKTRLVTAVAASYRLPLISLSAADVYSAYVGDAEAEVRRAFTLARQASPCILFFDELDSLVTNRGMSTSSSSTTSSSSSSVEARVLSTFLNEMDGVTSTSSASTAGVVVMAATNRLDCIDAALLRKGRFYQSIYVSPPNAQDRCLLLRYFAVKSGLSEDVAGALEERLRDGMSGADVENLCKEAALDMWQSARRQTAE